MHEIADALLQWYKDTRRKLPWRETSDPYKVWVSEVMLQQTRVETVIPYFDRFITRFPDVSALSQATMDEVLKYWEGLGYYSRVRRLYEAVREVEEKYDGVIPYSYQEFRELPGVGDYTAGAVLSIAYGKDTAAVDGNVLRVFSRLFGIGDDIGSVSGKRTITQKVQGVLPAGQAGEFNQAVMDLGARVCVRSHPRCGECPLADFCVANQTGTSANYPVKKQKRTVPELAFSAFFIYHDDRICVRQRPAKGLLAGLWELPYKPYEEALVLDADTAVRDVRNEFHIMAAEPAVYIGEYIHAFSHIRWRMQLFSIQASSEASSAGCRFVSPMERRSLTFGTIFNRMMDDAIKRDKGGNSGYGGISYRN